MAVLVINIPLLPSLPISSTSIYLFLSLLLLPLLSTRTVDTPLKAKRSVESGTLPFRTPLPVPVPDLLFPPPPPTLKFPIPVPVPFPLKFLPNFPCFCSTLYIPFSTSFNIFSVFSAYSYNLIISSSHSSSCSFFLFRYEVNLAQNSLIIISFSFKKYSYCFFNVKNSSF